MCENLGHPWEPLGSPHGALRLQHLPSRPLSKPNMVRIRVTAAALNFADALQLQVRRPPQLHAPTEQPNLPLCVQPICCRPSASGNSRRPSSPPFLPPHLERLQGLYQEKPQLPFVPGSECSGVVVEVGRDVRTVKVGDKVSLTAWEGGMEAARGADGRLPRGLR